MNGVHDMGGMHGMGRVEIENNEPVFHAEWERRVFALMLACSARRRWNIDMARLSRERMPPAAYLAASYYERWLHGLQALLVEKGLLSAKELESGRPEGRAEKEGTLRVEGVAEYLRYRIRARLADEVPPRLRVGDPVIARNINPVGHTRVPRYTRGRRGVIDRAHGVFIFPDASAATGEKRPRHLYSVRFSARELWGADAHARDTVIVALFDDYLDAA